MARTMKTQNSVHTTANLNGFKTVDENAVQGAKPVAKKSVNNTRSALKEMTTQPKESISRRDVSKPLVHKSALPKKAEIYRPVVPSKPRKEKPQEAVEHKSKHARLESKLDPMDVDTLSIEEDLQQMMQNKVKISDHPLLDPFRTRPADVEDIDEGDQSDAQFCSQYVPYIFAWLKEKEEVDRVNPNYLSTQIEVVERHRTILVDWMAEVAIKFRLNPETLFIAVGLLDRYLAKQQVPKHELQLVGTTALIIASKFEEISTPEVNDFVYITANAYTREEIIAKEKDILAELDYNITFPIPLAFLRRFSKAGQSDSRTHTLSKYLIELSLVDYSLLKYLPSEIAASASYLSRTMLGMESWNSTLEFHSGYTEQQILPCVRQLNELHKKQATSKHRCTANKYASSNFLKVSIIPHVDHILAGF